MTISAKMIADSVSADSPRLCTLQLRYPKFIHGELMTHRVFSRNASSSRAIPVGRLIQDVIDDPVYPSHWGKNQPGMSADQEHDEMVSDFDSQFGPASREYTWDRARESAIYFAQMFAAAGYHKQIVNRLLEPFVHINVVVTATQWRNFLALRDHPGAQPEIRVLAQEIRLAMAKSVPTVLAPAVRHLSGPRHPVRAGDDQGQRRPLRQGLVHDPRREGAEDQRGHRPVREADGVGPPPRLSGGAPGHTGLSVSSSPH